MRRIALAFALLLTLPVAALGQSEVVAQRGGIKMTAADVRAALDSLDPGPRAQLQGNATALAEFVRDRLLRQALLAEAKAANIEQNAALMTRANDARDAILVQAYALARAPVDAAYPSQAEIAAAYEANKARFAVPKQYHLSQIAFLVPANAPKDADDEAKRKAQDARAQALKPKADFADLARKLSQDKPTAEKGGDLGWVREDQLQPAFRASVAGMQPNSVAEPMRGPDAWHVVRLWDVRAPSTMPLEQASEAIVQALRQAKAQENVRAYVGKMLQAEPIQLNEIDLARQVAGGK